MGCLAALFGLASLASDLRQLRADPNGANLDQPARELILAPPAGQVDLALRYHRSLQTANLDKMEYEAEAVYATVNDGELVAIPVTGGQEEKSAAATTPMRVDPGAPERLVIPALQLNAPIVPSKLHEVKIGGQTFQQWQVPDQFAAGWHTGSARLGEPGNTVLNGHHNIHGEIFRYLDMLQPGDRILVHSATKVYTFVVANIMILPEKNAGVAMRMDNARWIQSSDDTRLTLVSCWPYESNTHRVIVVA